MNAFLQRSPQERLEAFLEVSRVTRLDSISVEKDFWVCWTLHELFTLPGIGEQLTFKGGTSLSKAWKLIERFSEDIDLIVDKEALGFGGDAAPDKAPSNKQRRLRLEALMSTCREWVQGKLMPGLTERIQAALGDTGWKIEVDPDMPDGQCLLFHYPSVFPAGSAGYVRPVVKIELGARSDDWPHEEKAILPYVIETFPAFAPDAGFPVRVLAAERTFWEKACLLHEETFRPADKPRKLRMARHYYDLWCLLRAGVGERALADKALFQRVAEHREIFFRYAWVSDVATDRVAWFVAEASAERKFSFSSTPTPNNVLLELGLIEKNRLLHAALMLFGKEPQRTCPSAVVKCSHYHGTEVVRPIPSQQVFGATLFEQIDAATDFVLSKLDRTIGNREDSNIATERLEIPKEAIREIIVNAVVHRDYDSGGSVQIDVFADRVEIMNPGNLPKEISVDDLPTKHLSVPVNPFLARPFFLAGYINQLGYGTRNVVKWCRQAGLPDPDFIPGDNQFRVTIWRNWLTDDRIERLDLNERQVKAIQFLKTQRRIANADYRQLNKVTDRTALRDLEDLLKLGIVVKEGKTGRSTNYRLAAKPDINPTNPTSEKPDTKPTNPTRKEGRK